MMRTRVEQGLKQFFPPAMVFALLILLLRVYQTALPEYFRGGLKNLVPLELSSVGYDFSFAATTVSEPTTGDLTLMTMKKAEHDFVLLNGLEQLTSDQSFEKARSYALHGDYFESRSILKSLLNASPNYHDARILLARTHGWEKEYDSAVMYLKQTIRRTPFYADAFGAWSDVEYRRADYVRSLEIVDEGLKENQSNADLLARKVRALMLLNKRPDAGNLVDEILNRVPDQELAVSLKQQLTVK